MGKRQLLNVLPNFAGVGAGLILPLLFNVVYYRLLGTEGYGLIGFYGLLAIMASLVDLGLSQTTLREVARRASDHEHAGELPSLVLTLALISCALGSLVGLSAVASSKWLATSWLDLSHLSVDEVATAIATMGGIVALLFPANILNATLRGLQRQVLFNTIAIVAGACRGAVTIAALHVFGSTPLIFFSAQLLISACEVMVLAVIVGVLLPRSPDAAAFRFSAVPGNLAVHLHGLALDRDRSAHLAERQGGHERRAAARPVRPLQHRFHRGLDGAAVGHAVQQCLPPAFRRAH